MHKIDATTAKPQSLQSSRKCGLIRPSATPKYANAPSVVDAKIATHRPHPSAKRLGDGLLFSHVLSRHISSMKNSMDTAKATYGPASSPQVTRESFLIKTKNASWPAR